MRKQVRGTFAAKFVAWTCPYCGASNSTSTPANQDVVHARCSQCAKDVEVSIRNRKRRK